MVKKSLFFWTFLVLVTSPLFAATPYKTYFSYSPEEISSLQELRSDEVMDNEELKKWDDKLSARLLRSNITYYNSVRLYTYLYVAQMEAAYLSYQAKGRFEGSLDPVVLSVVHLFYPQYVCVANCTSDAYSEKLNEIVFAKLKERYERENKLPFIYCIPDVYSKRPETAYDQGLEVAKWLPWKATPILDYYPKTPPLEDDPFWQDQLEAIKEAQKDLTDEQKAAIHWWAGESDDEESGDLRVVANQYIFSHPIPFEKAVLVRSQLMMGQYDATIAYISAKYHFLVIRPKIRDNSINYEIAVPMHPSYPSGHSTLCAVSADILNYYLPENMHEWERLSREGGSSRIWAGLHYPIDDEAGREIGNKVAKAILGQNVTPSNNSAPSFTPTPPPQPTQEENCCKRRPRCCS